MVRPFLFLVPIFICANLFAQVNAGGQKRDLEFYNATAKWFSAWTLVSRDIYKVDKVKPVEFVFFDDKFVYSTSSISIKNGTRVRGSGLMNLSLKWMKALHHDTLTLPDKSSIPIGLMSFAAEIPAEKNKSFFVMPLPSFWETAGVESEELGLANLVTGVFIHEFSHSQQMQNFGAKMTALEMSSKYDVAFSDDMIQELFSKDSAYVKSYKQEVHSLFQSVKGQKINKGILKEGLALINQRQNDYYKGEYANLTEIDDFFNTMEGLGQYSMYLWMINPNGGNIEKEISIPGVRRGGRWWSQDEGFALFLILEKLSAPGNWARQMFGDNTESVVSLIKKQLP